MLKCMAVCIYGRSAFKNERINPNNVNVTQGGVLVGQII